MSTIPASTIVQVNPSVLAAGGSSLDLNGLMLTNSYRIPIGSVQSFSSVLQVQDFFGPASIEASMAATYFAGFDNSNVKPGAMLAAQYNSASVSAYLQGGNVSNIPLTTLQGFSGTLSVTIDGVLKTGSVNLSGATSFTNAAEIIAGTLGIEGVQTAVFTGSITTTTLTTTAFASGEGSLGAGDVLTGTGVTAGTYIVSQLTSTETNGSLGGKGTYQVSVSQTVGSESITAFSPAVQYDSVSGSFFIFSGTTGASSTMTFGSGAMATDLLLTQVTGAVLSQGAVAAVQAAFMNTLSGNFRNWASFFTTFNPDTSGQITQRLAFAQWASLQNNRYVYCVTDSDVTPTTESTDAACLAQQIKSLGYAGSSVNWQPSETNLAAFVSGSIASIDFSQPGGRITFNGRQQAGLTPGVTDPTTQSNLEANGYNFYGAIGTANDQFQFYETGTVSGAFTWLDSLVNAIWLNNSFQLALIVLLQNTFSIPYNAAGNAMIDQALAPTIQQGLSFGAYRSGVTLSGSQAAAVNALAGGLNVAATLAIQGWYLFIGTAAPTVRQQRGSPPITFFYTDGEAVQSISLSSIALL